MNEKNQFPKEITTTERITGDSEKKEEITTIVNNDYEYKAVKVAIAYMDSFNKSDASGCDNLINFPHIRLSMQGLGIFKNVPMHTSRFFNSLTTTTGWNHSCWDYRRVIQSCETKVHLAIQFSRYKTNGTRIGSYPSLWVITNQKGHWGIKLRSSFAL